MKFNIGVLTLAATITAIAGVPATAGGQQRREAEVERSQNVRATTTLRSRITATEKRIAAARRSRAITPTRATALRRQIAGIHASLSHLSRQQGFVSAAELASYNRALGVIDGVLDDRGVPRSYGNDMLIGSNVAGADEERRFDCQNAPIAIAIPGDKLDAALDQLSRTTRCPISGTRLAIGKRSRPVVGTMTPTQALQAMLDGTGLQMQAIRQGFQVIPLTRR